MTTKGLHQKQEITKKVEDNKCYNGIDYTKCGSDWKYVHK
jgi:hypothetical protein